MQSKERRVGLLGAANPAGIPDVGRPLQIPVLSHEEFGVGLKLKL